MVTGVYTSHIGFYRGITVEVKQDLKDRMERYIDKEIPYEFQGTSLF